LVHGVPVVEYADGRVSQEIRTLWQRISTALGGEGKSDITWQTRLEHQDTIL